MASTPSHPRLTARRRTEASLANAQRVAHMGNWDWNLTSGKHTWSIELLRIFRLAPGAIVPSYDAFVRFAHPEDRAGLETALRGGTQTAEGFELDYRVQRADASIGVVRIVGDVLEDRSGSPAQLLCTIQDITDRSRERDLRDEQLAIITHDLKNAIAIIRGQAQFQELLLERSGSPTPERLVGGLRTIDTAAAQMMNMIDEVLDVARLKKGQALTLRLEPVNFFDLIRERVASYQHLTQVHSLRIVPPAAEIIGFWDRGHIARVLDNLISNAIKYSPQGGVILVSIDMETTGSGNWAVVTIQDHGIGLPTAELPFLGDSVRRGANVGIIAGTGLGLVGVRQIVAQHGGTLTGASTSANADERTTTFTVRLPLEDRSTCQHD